MRGLRGVQEAFRYTLVLACLILLVLIFYIQSPTLDGRPGGTATLARPRRKLSSSRVHVNDTASDVIKISNVIAGGLRRMTSIDTDREGGATGDDEATSRSKQRIIEEVSAVEGADQSKSVFPVGNSNDRRIPPSFQSAKLAPGKSHDLEDLVSTGHSRDHNLSGNEAVISVNGSILTLAKEPLSASQKVSASGQSGTSGQLGIRDIQKKLTVDEKCKPKQNIFYIRVHKTASTTVVATLYMYAHRHKLNIYLPWMDPFPHSTFQQYLLTYQNGSLPTYPFNVYAEHGIFNAREAAKVMPEDTVYVGSTRFPLAHLRSVFPEFMLEGRFAMQTEQDPVRTFLRQLYLLGPSAKLETKCLMAHTFGLPISQADNMTAVHEIIRETEEKFALVMITEFFDESMVLLRRIMCWETEDVLATNMRERAYRYKNTITDRELVEAHRHWSAADYTLYEYFNHLFFTKVAQEVDFWDEVYLYKLLKKKTEEFCNEMVRYARSNLHVNVYELAKDGKSIHLDARPWGQPFQVRAVDCLIRQLDTRVHRNIFKVKQYPELCTDPDIIRVYEDHATIFDINWIGSNAIKIHRAFCDKIDPEYDVPLEVLTYYDFYMWRF